MFWKKLKLTLGILALAGSALAVTGVVINQAGAPLSGVVVTLVTEGSTVNTDVAGQFTLLAQGSTSLKSGVSPIRIGMVNGALEFSLPQSVRGSLRTLDIHGKQINSLPLHQLNAGTHQYSPLGNNPVAPGIYVVQYQLGSDQGMIRLAVTNSAGKSNGLFHSARNVLRLTPQGALDSVSFTKAGYASKRVGITDYAADLGNVTLATEVSTCTPTTGGWQTCAANDPKVRIVGRSNIANPLRPSISWSGSAIQFAFTGTSAKIHLSGHGSLFNVFLDGNDSVPSQVLDLSNSTDTLHVVATGLSAGDHRITVYKRTEAQYGDAVFSGVEVLGTLSDLPAAKTRKIEFIGNSITCGYGNLVDDPNHTQSFLITTEDHSITYAALAARHLNAEEHAVCVSGRGIYRNNDNTQTGTLPTLFPLTSYNSTATWDFSRWTADIVVANLGTNDFYTGPPDSTGFVTACINFVKAIRTRYPNAKVLMVNGPMVSDYYPTNPATGQPYASETIWKRYLDAAKTALVAQGFSGVDRLSIPSQSAALSYGADWHPSRGEHALMASLLEAKITSLGWLTATTSSSSVAGSSR
jgi:lysophospholipase L1-like esterase